MTKHLNNSWKRLGACPACGEPVGIESRADKFGPYRDGPFCDASCERHWNLSQRLGPQVTNADLVDGKRPQTFGRTEWENRAPTLRAGEDMQGGPRP